MNISILGSGNVGTHFAHALSLGPHTICCVYSRTLSHAERLAREVGARAFTDSLGGIPQSDVLLFALKDDAVAGVADELHHTERHEDALWVHTSGSLPLAVLGKERRAAVVYPLQTFSKGKPIDMTRVPLFVEGADKASADEATALASSLSQTVQPLSSEQRAALHLAGVFANNFSNHCVAIACRMLRNNHLPPELLRPIVEETAAKLRSLTPVEAQTGPAVRWDTVIMDKHLRILQDNEPLAEIYRLMSQSIHEYSNTDRQ